MTFKDPFQLKWFHDSMIHTNSDEMPLLRASIWISLSPTPSAWTSQQQLITPHCRQASWLTKPKWAAEIYLSCSYKRAKQHWSQAITLEVAQFAVSLPHIIPKTQVRCNAVQYYLTRLKQEKNPHQHSVRAHCFIIDPSVINTTQTPTKRAGHTLPSLTEG